MKILRVLGTRADDVDNSEATEFSARDYTYHARILADVPVYVAIGAEADEESFMISEFDSHVLCVAAGQIVSVLGTDAGRCWVSEVRESS